MKDDSFGDGLTIGGKPRRLRVDFDSDNPAHREAHLMATLYLRRLNATYVHALHLLAQEFALEQLHAEVAAIIVSEKDGK